MLWLGSGVIGGIGLGLGYISPVSTLVKWFPDRRGMATGMAIMGFGGGAMIGAPLADLLMNHFRTPTSVGVWQTFLAMAAIYFVFMMVGAFGYRIPPAGWRPAGWTPPTGSSMITQRNVHLRDAHKTPQFWLIWLVLMLNVSAGIGVIGMASPMLQEIFGGTLIGHPDIKFGALSGEQRVLVAAIAAGFTGLLSLFNIGGRFFWASLSDYIGRKNTYYTFFLLGIALYAAAPWFAQIGSKALFVLAFCVILSMYGGGFATVPAYLADIFGTQFVGAIHGRLLTAWSTAGIVGPVVVNYIREFEIAAGVPRDHVYDVTMYILAGMLVLGLICNMMVKPLADKWFMKPEEVAALQAKGAAAGGGDLRHRHGRARRQGDGILGLRRHSAGVGRMDHAQERHRHLPIRSVVLRAVVSMAEAEGFDAIGRQTGGIRRLSRQGTGEVARRRRGGEYPDRLSGVERSERRSGSNFLSSFRGRLQDGTRNPGLGVQAGFRVRCFAPPRNDGVEKPAPAVLSVFVAHSVGGAERRPGHLPLLLDGAGVISPP